MKPEETSQGTLYCENSIVYFARIEENIKIRLILSQIFIFSTNRNL